MINPFANSAAAHAQWARVGTDGHDILCGRASHDEYRDTNQGPILSGDSNIFRRITREGFSGLQVDFNDSGEPVLTGVRHAGGEKIGVQEISGGTCDQLYLALGIARLENCEKHREPIPFYRR